MWCGDHDQVAIDGARHITSQRWCCVSRLRGAAVEPAAEGPEPGGTETILSRLRPTNRLVTMYSSLCVATRVPQGNTPSPAGTCR
jgi:hypothetical protein